MEPLWLFSPAETSIDVIGAIVFGIALYRACHRLTHNNLTTEGTILLIIISILSGLHIFQVLIQVFIGGPIGWYGITFKLWDLINYLTAFLFLMGVERIKKRETYEHN